MSASVVEQVVSFYNALFASLFVEPFRDRISDLLKRKAMARQIEEAADAASQTLSRFLYNQRVDENQVQNIFSGLKPLSNELIFDHISNRSVSFRL